MGNPGYHEAEAKALLGIPKDTGTACLVLLGYLAQSEHFGGAGRPIADATHYDLWGHASTERRLGIEKSARSAVATPIQGSF